MGTVPNYLNDSLGRAQSYSLQLRFALTAGTGVNSASYVGPNAPQLLVEGGTGSALTTITQAAVDALIGSGEIVVATALGTSAMVDNDTYAVVVNMDGQLKDVIGARAIVNIAGTAGVKAGVGTKTALTDAAFTGVNAYITPNGNLLLRLNYTNVSAAATAGHMFFDIDVVLK